MNTTLYYITDTPLDTAFRDKLYDMASDCVNLAGMSEGQFAVVDILPENEQQEGEPIYGQMHFKFLFLPNRAACYIYPARFANVDMARHFCTQKGETKSFKPWQLAD